MKELHLKDLFAMIGVLLSAIVWLRFYFTTKKKIFIGIAILTVVAGFFTFKNMGFTIESFENFFFSVERN
ncbi:hypothetical protein [Bacillus toyonensis]|uniref:Uncharacterized protein n=1 Tax=Bacillus toyonensis TaxID=155322 RepID=A0AAP8F2Q0_9BACI|nr:hypothetical protein [Bacillus toyonensis]PEB89946.1 hypothetical protein CON81_27935 [Bacillus toyonensis]PHE11408.1 hypothetical protein COF62_16300 [Bacillus toyonensis]